MSEPWLVWVKASDPLESQFQQHALDAFAHQARAKRPMRSAAAQCEPRRPRITGR